MAKKFDWNTIQKSTELILKEGNIIKIKFLNNDVDVDSWKNETSGKEKPKFNFDVLDMNLNKEKTFGILSNPLMNELKEYQPLMNKEFSIEKFRVGATEFDIEYRIIHLNSTI